MTTSNHPLKPDENIHKILISTTCRIVGEFVSDDMLITHAWQNVTNSSGTIRMEESPISRTGFIVAFRAGRPSGDSGILVPDYTPTGEIICSYLSVLYGKRFDCHGLVEGSGFYNIPDLSAYNGICNPILPFNTHKHRSCFKIPLNLSRCFPFSKIFSKSNNDFSNLAQLNAACKFYMQALQNAECEPEVAYLHLITSGEILSGFFDYEKEEILDDHMINTLRVIESKLEGGDKIARDISSRLLGIKKRFVKSLLSLIDTNFFEHGEENGKLGSLNPDSIERSIGAAYDLRSKYVHTGVPFGSWIQPSNHLNDLQFGRPIVEDKDFSRILERAPTFLGLERIIRYCLLTYMASNGFPEIMELREDDKRQTTNV